jgi:hypothetical protein
VAEAEVRVGHWFSTLQPFPRTNDRIALNELQERILKATVALRGWDYPHMELPLRNLDGGIESRTDWNQYHQEWRLMRSGFFAHRWQIQEDESPGWEGTLDFINAIWTMTEVFQFAKRLYGTDSTVESLTVTLELQGLKGRRLAGSPEYMIRVNRLPDIDEFRRDVNLGRAALNADPDTTPCEWAQALFHVMGAPGISLETLKGHQRRLLERRFR